MSKVVPWSIKGVDFDAREAAKEAARRAGMTLGGWMNQVIAERAEEIGVSAQDFDTEERLEAVAAQLARLSREREETPPPQRRRGESARQEEPPRPDFSQQQPLRQAFAQKDVFRQEPDSDPNLNGETSSGQNGQGQIWRKPTARQAAGRQAALDQEPARKEPRRASREIFDAESLLEQAVAEFQEQA